MSKLILALGLALVASRAALAQSPAAATTTPADAQTFFSFQVEEAARVKNPVAPEYPASLRSAKVGGEVLVQFVVDEKGLPQMDTFKVLRSTNNDFTESVKRVVSATTFYPAENQGHKVKQLVQQPFRFVADK